MTLSGHPTAGGYPISRTRRVASRSTCPFPGPDGKVQVRTEGGELRASPHWSVDGRRLFYVSPEETIFELTVTVRESALEVGPPQKLFSLPPESLWRAGQGYWGVSSDGQRFYLVQPVPE